MTTHPPPPKGHDRTISFLNEAIEALNLAKDTPSVTPAKAVFGSAGVLLRMIKVRSLTLQLQLWSPNHVHLGLDGE